MQSPLGRIVDFARRRRRWLIAFAVAVVLVWRAIGNVLLKAVTAPFALLGKLFGGGSEKIDVVDFQAGTAALTPAADKTLQGLTKAPTSRPALKMDIEGTTDAAADVKSLKLQEVHRQAQLAKGGKGPRPRRRPAEPPPVRRSATRTT